VRIVDTSQKNADGKAPRELLIEILDKFPSYYLLSEESAATASHDIEASLQPCGMIIPRVGNQMHTVAAG